ncbi:hypothetical protein CMU30_02195 [Elizabethkingia anophelis]|nr:hypothetical protein [Elizabethkingia anophelis]MDV3682187.1 hypothetical protein [Elizabethkingia anophelis]MDV3701843.1 hypothetical protein [Elizabethkingia anophelis]MDV3761149.1 hypothetical protein [Elizabethkingia anophelis]MDV3800345.1 hypothetical protein [Elizabethkingia anophelis]
MSSLFNYFTERDLELILFSLEAQEKKWNAVAKKPIQGYGKATEYAKKKEAKAKALEFRELQNKVSENTY